MKVKNKRVGDIYFNPLACDLWILNKIWNEEYQKEVWTLNLVHTDFQECLRNVEKFIKVGNIYDLVFEKIERDKNDSKGNVYKNGLVL